MQLFTSKYDITVLQMNINWHHIIINRRDGSYPIDMAKKTHSTIQNVKSKNTSQESFDGDRSMVPNSFYLFRLNFWDQKFNVIKLYGLKFAAIAGKNVNRNGWMIESSSIYKIFVASPVLEFSTRFLIDGVVKLRVSSL